MILETRRLTLRPFQEEDVDRHVELMGNRDFMRFSAGPRTREEPYDTLQKFLSREEAGSTSRYARLLNILISLVFHEIEPAGRICHTGRREIIVNGFCRAGAGFAAKILRIKLDRDKIIASSRRVELHRHRVATLHDLPLQGDALRVKHVASIFNGCEEGVEVSGRNRLSDREDVIAGWRRDPHPI